MKNMHETTPHDVTSTLATEFLKEKRAERRWRNIRFICWFGLFALTLFAIFKHTDGTKVSALTTNKYVAFVRLNGMISPDSDFSAEQIVPVLKEAFSDKNAEGVVIDINSPGGTPVQASIIHDAILSYKKIYKKRVIIVGEDLLTSGAY